MGERGVVRVLKEKQRADADKSAKQDTGTCAEHKKDCLKKYFTAKKGPIP
jgi:hypothetical protein